MANVAKLKRWGGGGLHFGLVAAFTGFLAFPFYWMLITMFKQNSDLENTTANPFFFHQAPTLQNIQFLFHQTDFARWFVNTTLVGFAVVVITVLLAVPAGYALARLTGGWGQQLGIGIFLTYLIPPTILFIPFSKIVAMFNLQDSLWSLVLVYPSFTVPFCTWLMMGFFKAIPVDVEEAAIIDGYSRLGAFLRVVMPISFSGILTVVIFSLTLVVQEFVYGITFISATRSMTVSIGVPTFGVRGDVFFWGALMAGCFIASVPIAILYNIFADRFVAGFTVGAVK